MFCALSFVRAGRFLAQLDDEHMTVYFFGKCGDGAFCPAYGFIKHAQSSKPWIDFAFKQ